MYKLPYFTEEDQEKVIAFMKEYSFAVITGLGEEFPVASHIPLNVDIRGEKIFLTGHLMKNTDHHKAFEKNNNVLVIFNGPHTYVSASWYDKPGSASTWNYITVHARGIIKFTDEAGTLKAIRDITDKYEGTISSAAFDRLSTEYIERLVKAIVGFEIEVVSMENVFKLSQNHNEETRINISNELMKRGDDNSTTIAKEVRKRLDNE